MALFVYIVRTLGPSKLYINAQLRDYFPVELGSFLSNTGTKRHFHVRGQLHIPTLIRSRTCEPRRDVKQSLASLTSVPATMLNPPKRRGRIRAKACTSTRGVSFFREQIVRSFKKCAEVNLTSSESLGQVRRTTSNRCARGA